MELIFERCGIFDVIYIDIYERCYEILLSETTRA
jgi:hypothetical protein